MKKGLYESPATEVVVVKTERTILSAQVNSSRASYGSANYGVDSSQQDTDGNWLWN